MGTEPSKKGRKKKSSKENPVGRPPKHKTKIVIPLNQGGSGSSTATSSKTDKRKNRKSKSDNSSSGKAKDKTPINVERQCGVALPNGGYCARSLTCKTHSMGAKRAVQGRSMPYDVLLAAYQKRNQVKMASLSTQQQLELDNEALMDEQPLNVEEEFEQVMAGVVRAYPVPLERKVVMPTKLRTGIFRMREMLIGSLTTVPHLPSVGSDSSSSSGAQQSVNSVMSATGAVLGRTIVFDSVSGAQYARPPRVYVNPNANLLQQQQQQQQQQQHHQQQQQSLLMRQRQLQLAMQQRANSHGLAATNGVPSASSSASSSSSLLGSSSLMNSQMTLATSIGGNGSSSSRNNNDNNNNNNNSSNNLRNSNINNNNNSNITGSNQAQIAAAIARRQMLAKASQAS